MNAALRQHAIAVCDAKIAQKGARTNGGVGLSFYAFFANKNSDPEALMQAAEWWIKTNRLDHFEKAVKIRDLLMQGL